MTDKALVSYQGQQVWVTLLTRTGLDYRAVYNGSVIVVSVIDILSIVSEC